jgi:SiaC family regulatory phosphoprotein
MDISILSNEDLPSFTIKHKEGFIEIAGRSIPNTPMKFYNHLLHEIDNYIPIAPLKTIFHFKLDYFNTSSHRYLVEMLRKLNTLNKNQKKFNVIWYYSENDLDHKEIGEIMSKFLSLEFEYQAISES